jgi:uncharacterized protein (DUF433 family)
MNNLQHNELIGLGIYTLQEASLYGGITVNKLSRWLFGAGSYSPVIEAQLYLQHLVSFYDLVQTMAINRAREEGIPLPKIREAIQFAQLEYDVKFPLAYNHKLLLFERDLHIQLPSKEIVQASGKIKGQRLIRPIVEPFITDLHFDVEGWAIKLVPFKKYGRAITLDPAKQFGQPLVGDTGYRADILDQAYSAEGSYDLIASTYGIDVKDAKTAVAYMKKVRKAA